MTSCPYPQCPEEVKADAFDRALRYFDIENAVGKGQDEKEIQCSTAQQKRPD